MQSVNAGQYHLAQVNTAKMRYSLDAPEMADFVAQINSVNAVADDDPGFVWRLRGESASDATSIRVFDDESILITLTVCKSLEALSNYVYHGAHSDIMRSRRRWFEKVEQQYGSTPYAFSFRKPFSPFDALEYEQLNLALT